MWATRVASCRPGLDGSVQNLRHAANRLSRPRIRRRTRDRRDDRARIGRSRSALDVRRARLVNETFLHFARSEAFLEFGVHIGSLYQLGEARTAVGWG